MDQLYQDLCKILPGVDCTLCNNEIRIMGKIFTIQESKYEYSIISTGRPAFKISRSYDGVLNYFQEFNKCFQEIEDLRQTLISSLSIFKITAEIVYEYRFFLRLKFYDNTFIISQLGNGSLEVELKYRWLMSYSKQESIEGIKTKLYQIISDDSRIINDLLQAEYLDTQDNNFFNIVSSIVNQQTEMLIS